MTGRERVMAVLNREKPDRIPYDLGGTDCSSVHIITYAKLREKMGLPEKPVKCGCLVQLIAEFDKDIMKELRVDAETLNFWSQEEKVWNTPFGIDLIIPEKFDIETLEDGSTVARKPDGTVYSKKASDSYYFDPVAVPLADLTDPGEVDQYDDLFERWDYSYVYDEPVEKLAQRAEKQYASTDRAVIALWRLHYLQSGQLMRGYDTFLMDVMINKDMAHAVMGKLHEVYMKRVDEHLAAYADHFDAVFLTDDLGTQLSGLMSPDSYKEIIFPYISEVAAKIKSAGKKIIMHSCGAIAEFIPYLIEMGIDAVNPVQVSASGMNPKDLVREYGKDIAFWGGGIDTQNALNSPDLEVVRADVRRRLEEFGPDASLVFTQVHNIQYDVPPENILAMHDEFFKQVEG